MSDGYEINEDCPVGMLQAQMLCAIANELQRIANRLEKGLPQ